METITFEELGLCPEIERAVRFMGFEEASPIQTKAIPAIISGKILSDRHRPELEKPLHLVFHFFRK